MSQHKMYFYFFSLFAICSFYTAYASSESREIVEARKEYVVAQYMLDSHRYFATQMQMLQPTVVNTSGYFHETLSKDEAFFMDAWNKEKRLETVLCKKSDVYQATRQRIEKAKTDYLKKPMNENQLYLHRCSAQTRFGKACGWQ